MKKIFSIAAIVLMGAAALVSCKKGDNGGKEETVVKRVKTFSEVGDGWADVYAYTYDAQGRVSNINRSEGEKVWDFAYSGNKVTVTYTKKGETPYVAYVLTLNEKGLCTSMVDEWEETRTYTYNSEGRIIKVEKEGELKSELSLEDGCILYWTKNRDGEWAKKNHKYTSTKNIGDIHNIYSEATDPSRWMYETGLFGHGTAYLCGENQWDYSEAKGILTYEFDADGYVIAEHKDYPDWPENWTYEWEVVKK